MCLCALNVLPVHIRALAAATHRDTVAHVMVQLRGQPLAATTSLRRPSGSVTRYVRPDLSLGLARTYDRAMSIYQSKEIAYIRGRGIRLHVGRQFRLLFNGFTAAVPTDQLSALRSLSNVNALLPVPRYAPLLDSSATLVHAPQAWSELGGAATAGRGLKIADIDTGIDISNPCFRDSGMPRPGDGFPRADTPANLALTNNKVIVARAFGLAGKQYSAADHVGHGTFTAAIEACDYNTLTPVGSHVSGMAPAAYLMSYNVSPTGTGQTASDDPILAALEMAFRDGADVINLSFGNPLGPGDPRLDPNAAAISTVIKAGIPVIVAAGNAGPTAQTATSWASDSDAIAVGSTTNAHGLYSSVLVGGSADVPKTLQHIKASKGSYAWSTSIGPASAVYVGLGRRPKDDGGNPGADDFAGKQLQGKIALMQRGTISFETKVRNAGRAGAIAVVVFDNTAETTLPSPYEGSASLPTMLIPHDAGTVLLSWIQTHPHATITMRATPSAYPETPNIISSFSSVGYGAGYAIKPDLVAPGEDIYSATESRFPNGMMYDPSGFSSQSGTSFSAPHVTGIAALLLQKHPTWSPRIVKAVLMGSANSGVSLDPSQARVPSVMQMGAGLIDAGAALAATGYLYPTSCSLGLVNLADGPVKRHFTLTLTDLGNGAGSWSAAVKSLHGSSLVTVDVPNTIDLLPSGHVAVPLTFTTPASAPPGDYDGFVTLTHEGQSIHVPYFLHVVSQVVKPGSILLVDDTLSRFQPLPPAAPVRHVDVTRWYEQTLQRLHRAYTYWNEGSLGPPSLSEAQRASAIIYFTGANLNGYAPQNTNAEAIIGPLSSGDTSLIHAYMDTGGRVFVSGMAAALSDPYWSGTVMGGAPSADFVAGASRDLSIYDNKKNDTALRGGISPPTPSAIPDTDNRAHANKWLFSGMKPIDFGLKGDGAHDNVASFSAAVAQVLGTGIVGIPGLIPVHGNIVAGGTAYGQGALLTTRRSLVAAGADVAVVSSDEPSLTHVASYRGRGVLFAFGFEGINDNTGYATRTEVMQRILQWFADAPTASVVHTTYGAGKTVALRAILHGGSKPAQYTWQIGSRIMGSTTGPTSYRFPHPGTYSARVLVVDALGHSAVSSWTALNVD